MHLRSCYDLAMKAHQIIDALVDLGLSQAEISRRVGVTPRAIGMLRSGLRKMPGADTYLALLDALRKEKRRQKRKVH